MSLSLLALVVVMALSACAKPQPENKTSQTVPVGPGTDTSVLRPPDTPGSPPEEHVDSVRRKPRSAK